VKAWRIGWRLIRQDRRSGELYLLGAALMLTVAAVAAVGFFTDRIEQAMQRQGGELIAADLALDGSAPLSESYVEQAHALGLATARTLEFPSVVLTGERTQLVQVKAVDPAYPLRGALRVKESLDGSAEPATVGPPLGEAWVESRLLYLLDLAAGASLRLGEKDLRVTRIIDFEPDRGGNLFQLAPRVMIAAADVPATGLVSPASRVRYRLLVAGDLKAVERYKGVVTALPPPNARMTDAREAQPAFASAVERASRFLHLATLVTLLVAGAAIALASRRLVERQIDAVAVMRCLGAQRHLLTRIFAWRLTLLGLSASLIGCLIGYLAQEVLAGLLAGWFGPELPPPSLKPVAVGVGTGLITLLGFALPPLLRAPCGGISARHAPPRRRR